MYIHAKVKAGARAESIAQKSKDHFEISVCEPAERNMANKRVIALLADFLTIPESHVRIINGHHSPSKLLSVEVDLQVSLSH